MASAYSQFLSQTMGLQRINDMRSAALGSRNTSSTAEPGQNRRLRTPGSTMSRSLKGLDDEFKSYYSGIKNISGLQQIKYPHHEEKERRDYKHIDWEKLMENEEDLDVNSVENEDANYFLKPTHFKTPEDTEVLHKPEEKSETSDGNRTTKTQKLICKGDHADTKGITSIGHSHISKTTYSGHAASASTERAYRENDVDLSHQISIDVESSVDSSSSSPKFRQHFYTISQLDTHESLTPKISISEEMDDQELEVPKSSSRDSHPLYLQSTAPALIHSKFDSAGPTRTIASEKPFQFSATCQLNEGEDLDYPSTSSNIRTDSQCSDLLSSLKKYPDNAQDHEEDSTDIQESILEEILEKSSVISTDTDIQESILEDILEKSVISTDTDIQESILEEILEKSSVISTDTDIQKSILEEILEGSSLISTEENTDIQESILEKTLKESSAVNTEENMEHHHAGILEESSATSHEESKFESESDKTCNVVKMYDPGSGMSPESTLSYTLDFSNGNESKETEQEQHKDSSMVNAGTQTHTDDSTKKINLYSWSYPMGPHQFGRQYLDPPPLEVLSSYTPNMLALNDMLRAQLRLTRQLLEIHRSLLEGLTSSLRPDYHYTTLQDTRHFIQTHKPKVLTFSEAKKKCRHKRDS